MKLFHTLLAVLLFVAIVSIDAKAEDCPEGYEYGGVMKIMDLTDCCELWAEYCWMDQYPGTDLTWPKIHINKWLFVTDDPECNIEEAHDKLLENIDLAMQKAAEIILPDIENGEYINTMFISLCSDEIHYNNTVTDITTASCITDPYLMDSWEDGQYSMAYTSTPCSPDAGTCKYVYKLCYKVDEYGLLNLHAEYDSVEKIIDGICPESKQLSELLGGRWVNCHVICE